MLPGLEGHAFIYSTIICQTRHWKHRHELVTLFDSQKLMFSWEDIEANLKNINNVSKYSVGSRFNDEEVCCEQWGYKEVVNLTWGNQGRMLKEGNADKKNLETWLVWTRGKGLSYRRKSVHKYERGKTAWCGGRGTVMGSMCWNSWLKERTRRWGAETSWRMLGSGLLFLKERALRPCCPLLALTFLRMRRRHLPHFSGKKNEAPSRIAGLSPEIIWGIQAWSPKVQWPPSVLAHSHRKLPKRIYLHK